MIALVYPAQPVRGAYSMTVVHPDGTITRRTVFMADLRQEYREATGRELQFVCLGIDGGNSADEACVEMYVIPISQRSGDPEVGTPFRGLSFEIGVGHGVIDPHVLE